MEQEIITNDEIAPGIFRMAVAAWEEILSAVPGQFLYARCSAGPNPLLRRPFSIHDVGHNLVKILYKVVGTGTEIFALKKPGEKIDVIGPLGKGFHTEPAPQSAVLLAGGIGIAPLLFLASRLRTKKLTVLLGAGTCESLLCRDSLKKLGCKLQIATEDGSCGEKGQIYPVFAHLLDHRKPDIVYACGPRALLEKTAAACGKNNIFCQVSMESQMGCGVGACLGCVIRTKNEHEKTRFTKVCKEGPVFDAATIVWK